MKAGSLAELVKMAGLWGFRRARKAIIPTCDCATFREADSFLGWSIRTRPSLVVVVDDDDSMRSAVQDLLEAVGLPARGFASAEEFLSSGKQHETACLIHGYPHAGNVRSRNCRRS